MHSRKARTKKAGLSTTKRASSALRVKSSGSNVLSSVSLRPSSSTSTPTENSPFARNIATSRSTPRAGGVAVVSRRQLATPSINTDQSHIPSFVGPKTSNKMILKKVTEVGVHPSADQVSIVPSSFKHRGTVPFDISSRAYTSTSIVKRPNHSPVIRSKRFFSSLSPDDPSVPATPRVPVDKISKIQIDPSKIDPNKKFQHYGVNLLGPEEWKELCVTASENINKYIDINRAQDTKASGLDPKTQLYRLEKITPQDIHELYRDLSHIEPHRRHNRIIDLYLAAVRFIRRDDDLERSGAGGGAASVTTWLMFLQALVFIMVLVGGLTRLTKSGLSMTHWKFFGEKRPTTDEEWEKEFALYKESPEYKLHNTDMTLDEFKFIYHMEYGHRTLGRMIGVAFTIPFAYFLAKGKIKGTSQFGKQLLATLSLGGVQGLIGWWMVKSGLDEEKNQHKANVSPYRLATHLITAFALLTGLNVLTLRAKYGKIDTVLNGKKLPTLNYMGMYVPKKLAHAMAGVTFMTAASGAFVAGNDAGKVYNEFPLMGGQVIPSDIINPYIKPVYKNLFENQTTVQFMHRCGAMSTLGLSYFTALKCGLNPKTPANIRRAAFVTALAATAQAGLGISTLLTGVPIDLAAAHQGGAMLLLLSASRLMFLANNPAIGIGKRMTDELAYRQGLLKTVLNHKAAYSAPKAAAAAQEAASAATKAATTSSPVTKSSAALAALLGASVIKEYVDGIQEDEDATDVRKINL